MKQIFLFLATLFFSIAFAQPSPSTVQEQWFIQLAAFSSVENAIDFQKSAQSKLNEIYSLERKLAHNVSIHPRGDNYRALLGPYMTKENAQTTQLELADIYSSSMVIKIAIDTYNNYQYGYKFTWHGIDQNTYQRLYKSSLAALRFDNFVAPSLGEKISLIANTDQINEEVFDIKKAKQLLDAKNFILIQNDPLGTIVDGYKINNEEFSTGWPYFFYAYYPTENLIVLMGEGEELISLTTNTGEWTLKMPYNTLYLPNKSFRITSSTSMNIGYFRSHVELYDEKSKQYRELMDLEMVSPWLSDTQGSRFAWFSNNEIIFILDESRSTDEGFVKKTSYYRVTIDRI